MTRLDLLVLASEGAEGVPADHIAAKLAVPLGIVIFSGAVFALLWSNYGARKGAAIYATAMFGFTTMLGVFWWFGAPGTPVATGLQNFPGQPADAYQGRWHGFEAGSERAEFFAVSNDFASMATLEEYAGTDDDADPNRAFLRGDLDQAAGAMLEQWLPTDASGTLRIGASRRQALQEAAGPPRPGEARAEPFFTAEVADLRVADDGGVRVAGAELVTSANFVDDETGASTRSVEVEQGLWFAFKDPGALWFPSAVWTGVSFVLFALSLFWLDRIEMRQKQEAAEVKEAEDLAVPIAQ